MDEVETTTKTSRRSITLENVSISAEYTTNEYVQQFRRELKNPPFPHICLRNFLDNRCNFVEAVETELQNFDAWSSRDSDLMSLYQTLDFRGLDPAKQPKLFSFRQFLLSVVKPWLSTVSGVELTSQVDVTGSCYADAKYLLPHNDQIESRHFAFVYYLTEPNWKAENGGSLFLYGTTANKMPGKVVKSLLPYRNSFVIFEVSPISWHSVQEVLQDHSPRLSINGWFHSKRKLPEIVPYLDCIPRLSPEDRKMSKAKHLNGVYCGRDEQQKMQQKFEEKCEMVLHDFLQPAASEELLTFLNACTFSEVGPPNKRRMFRLGEEQFHAQRTLKWLLSASAQKYFHAITECDILSSKLSLLVQKVQSGCYTLTGDEDVKQAERDGQTLDIHLFLGEEYVASDLGGTIHYVAKNDEDEITHVTPTMNAAAIICKDPDVYSFLKYVPYKATGSFYLITLTYYNLVQ